MGTHDMLEGQPLAVEVIRALALELCVVGKLVPVSKSVPLHGSPARHRTEHR